MATREEKIERARRLQQGMSREEKIAEARRLQTGEAETSTGQQLVKGVREGVAGLVDLGSRLSPLPGAPTTRSIMPEDLDRAEASGQGVMHSLDRTAVEAVERRISGPEIPEPRTIGQKLARTGGEFLPGSVAVGGPIAGASRTPIRSLIGEIAALGGAATGSVAAEEIAPDNPYAQIIGTLLGGVSPAGLQDAASFATKRLLAGSRKGAEARISTFESAGTTPSAGQATGKGRLDFLEQTLGAVPGSQGKIARFGGEQQRAIGQRTTDVAEELAPGASPERAGRAITEGIVGEGGFLSRFKGRASQLFSRLDESIPSDRRVSVGNFRKTLDEISGRRESAGSLKKALSNDEIARIKEAADADAPDGLLSFGDLQEVRSLLGEKLASSELISGAPKGQLKRLYASLSEDMRQAAANQSQEALNNFNRANNFYKAGVKRIEDVLEKAAKKATPEEVFSFAMQGSKEGATRIRSLKRSLKPEEWKIFASTVIRRMGRANPSQQDDLGELFSSETFLTNWNRMSKEAKAAMFGGTDLGPVRNQLDDIASTASMIRESAQSLANPSGTAQRGANIMTLFALGGAGGAAAGGQAGAALAIPLIAGGLATTRGVAQLVTKPEFVKWLARGTKMSADRIPGHLARLGQVLQDEDESVREAASRYIETLQGILDSGREGLGVAGMDVSPERGIVSPEAAQRAGAR